MPRTPEEKAELAPSAPLSQVLRLRFAYSFSNSLRNNEETSASARLRGHKNARAPSETLTKTFPVLFPLLNSAWATRNSRILVSLCGALFGCLVDIRVVGRGLNLE